MAWFTPSFYLYRNFQIVSKVAKVLATPIGF
jgi:hypothetical protein